MELQHIELTNLSISPLNVRKSGAKSVDDLLPSIQANGIIQPLLVRPSDEGFEVVAGQRRYHALQKLAETHDDESGSAAVPCMVMERGDDAKAMEASLAENIARLPMDEIDQYKAFAALIKQGREVSEIADQFGISERLVKQRLAIANLISPLLTAYRKGEIEPSTVRLLTMATKSQQKAWLSLFRSEDEYEPEGYRLKCWLFGGAEISVDAALFDHSEYTGTVISDLFGEDQYFDDMTKFWALQNTEIAQKKDAYLADGWSDVVIWEVGDYFPSYEYVDTAKEEGGKIFIVPACNGEVTIYEGQLSRADIKKKQRKNSDASKDAPEKPELTQPMQNYLNVHRHVAVRLELLNAQELALRVAVAQMIAGSELWQIYADPQKTANDGIDVSLRGCTAQSKFTDQREAIFKLLGFKSDNNDPLVPLKSDWAVKRDIHEILAKLLKLDDQDVLKILTFVVAETLPCGSALVEVIGSKLEMDMGEHWQNDECFFSLLRDKEAINAMLKEVAGKKVADANITSTAKVQKQLISEAVVTNSDANWQPRYMAFPMCSYTKRSGLRAMEDWAAVKKRYK